MGHHYVETMRMKSGLALDLTQQRFQGWLWDDHDDQET